MGSITVEIDNHFPIHNVHIFMKHIIYIIIIRKMKAYITMTSQIQLPNLCIVIHISVYQIKVTI